MALLGLVIFSKKVKVMSDFKKIFSDLDFAKFYPVKDSQFAKKTYIVGQIGEEKLEYSIILYVAEKLIGKIAFVICEENYLFVTNLENCSIDPQTGLTQFKGVGTALLNCVKLFLKEIGGKKIRLTAQTPFSTALPKNHNLVEFYQKQGFEKTDEKMYSDSIRMEWLL